MMSSDEMCFQAMILLVGTIAELAKISVNIDA